MVAHAPSRLRRIDPLEARASAAVVASATTGLQAPALGQGAGVDPSEPDLVVFGHSHIPLDLEDEELGLRIFNPGSPTDRRRQRQGTMGLLRVDRGRLTAARIVPVT